MTQVDGHDELINGTQPDDPFALWDGAYVLGALSASDKLQYESHLSACKACRNAVAELTGIPPLLGLLDPEEVRAIEENRPEPPLRPEVLDSLLAKVRRRRRWSRRATAGVAALAAALLAVGLVIIARPEIVGLQRQEPAPVALAMEQVVPSPVTASVSLTGMEWGTQIDMTCSYGSYADRDQKGGTFALVVVGRDGSRTEAATWRAEPNQSVTLGAATSLPVDQIATVQLVSTDNSQMLLQRNL